MAKSTPTTKAKTKTTKKPAAKARTAAAKTTRSTKTTKAVKPVATKVTAKKKAAVLSTNSLRKLNLLKAFVLAGLAVAAVFLMNSATYAVTVGYQAKDELISLTAGKTAFVHGSQGLVDVQVRWLVIIILGLAALFSLLSATRMRDKFEASLKSGVSPMRWVGWGITSALMVEVIALISGVSDIWVLKIVAALMLITCGLAWVSEKRGVQAGRPIWSEFVISLFTGALPWVLIGGYAVGTWVYGLIRYPWFVYALYATTIVGFVLLTGNQYKRISGWKNALVLERNYLMIGLATKAAFGVILILAFQK